MCQCPQTSPIVEDLIAMAPLPHLTKLFQILHKDWQVLCTSPAASHILERIITVLPKFISKSVADKDIMSSVKNREDENVNDTVKLIRLLMDVSDLMLEDLESVFTHVYYSHVLRTLLQVLGGTRVGESLLKSRTSRERSKEGMNINMYTVKHLLYLKDKRENIIHILLYLADIFIWSYWGYEQTMRLRNTVLISVISKALIGHTSLVS